MPTTRTKCKLDDPVCLEPDRSKRSEVARHQGAERQQTQETNDTEDTMRDDFLLVGKEGHAHSSTSVIG